MANGCSFIQWLINRLPWRDPVTECCNWHDLAYAASGIPKAVADSAFFYCLNAVSNPVIAGAFFSAVSAFGWMFYKRKKKL